MPDLTDSLVTIERAWMEGGTNGKQLSCRQVSINFGSGSFGGLTNRILAAVLQLTKIEQSSPFVTTGTNRVWVSSPSADGTMLLFFDVNQATDGNRNLPVDNTSLEVCRGVVKGYL